MYRRLLAALVASAATLGAQQPIDAAYTAKIRELTPTDPNYKFTTELVDHLPASKTVPTPLAVLGYVPGTIGRLGNSAEIYRYFRTVADKSPRVKIYSMGRTELGREMIVAAISDEATIGRLDEYKRMTNRMADPRGLQAAERAQLVRDAKPIYYISASIHSPETGSPDMTMELLYRLAVDESDYYKAIRKHVIVMINPVFEADGRDHQVDWYNQQKALKITAQQSGGLPYWGKYVAHDNNRDGMVVSLNLTRNWLKTFLEWRPTITHDLHESVPFLYTSTGSGPYNEEFDPLTIDEWHTLAYQEITELTRRGLPGVWTHNFYDGWAANYQNAIANLHNAAGRFYETYTASGADCIDNVRLPATATSRTWDRSSPPVNGIKWCIRSNQNYQQSGLLIALKYVADHRETFVANNIAKNENTVQRGRRGPLYAFVVPRGQRHAGEAADLVNLFRLQGAEVHAASADFTVKDGSKDVAVKTGDWIVRLDQPNALFPRTVLAIQRFKPEDPNPYDDTGWTLDELRHVTTLKVQDSTIFAKPMTMLTTDATVAGSVAGNGATLVVRHLGDWRSAIVPFKVAPAAVSVADSAFVVDRVTYPAGTWLVSDAPAARAAIRALGGTAVATAAVGVKQHAVQLPRIALAHAWSSTQDEGWVRITFDKLGIPYTYLADQKFKQPGLLEQFDVVVYPNAGNVGTLVNGRPKIGPAVPWKKTAATPSLGEIDETDDVRDGIGLDGVLALRRFVDRGGMLLVEGGSVNLPISLQFTTGVSVVESRALQARGGVFRAQAVTTASPILYGYDDKQFPLFFSNSPLLQVAGAGGPGGGAAGGGADQDTAYAAALRQRQAKVIVRFHSVADSLLVSGQLNGGGELAGKAAVVDAPVGAGHVVLFATRPFWRWQTQGAWALAFNAMVHWNALAGSSATPAAGARRP